ncbi:MAG: hypothetical protein GF308_11625 [Candidatus Heimdallarchaeota archaeon]|nr:hypothetical protein [Candidatus Heimdallarchaeota archaeon]
MKNLVVKKPKMSNHGFVVEQTETTPKEVFSYEILFLTGKNLAGTFVSTKENALIKLITLLAEKGVFLSCVESREDNHFLVKEREDRGGSP